MSLELSSNGNAAHGSGADSFTVCAPDGEANDLTLVGQRDMLADGAPLSSEKRTSKTHSGTKNDGGSSKISRTQNKAKLARSACAQCQKRKTRCSGRRPLCHSCTDRGLSCVWDTGDGLTRTADLKKKLCEATRRSDNLDTLVNAMRYGTDQASSMLLAKMRFGMSLQVLLDGIYLESLAMDTSNLEISEDIAYSQPSLNPLHLEQSATKDNGDMRSAEIYPHLVTGQNE